MDADRRFSNREVAWWSLALGAATGTVLGLWSFDGPVPTPPFLGAYDETARRLARLGHIAFFGLGFLNLFVARELPRLGLTEGGRRLAARAMNFGNLGLPLTLFAASAYAPLKYAMALPASAVLLALVLTAYGVRHDDR
ncbi:MAG: hypothetical protein ACYTGZ_05905 [Planctomycetota bacterium]